MVDGREYPGKLYARDEARAIYESIVRTRRDPGVAFSTWDGPAEDQLSSRFPAGAQRQLVLK